MKSLFFPTLILCSVFYAQADTQAPTAKHTRTKTDFKKNPMIKKLDGTLFDAAAYHETLLFLKMIQDIQYGSFNATTNTRNGLYTFNNAPVSLQDLIKKEHECIKSGIDKQHADWVALQAVIKQAKDDYFGKTAILNKKTKDNAIAQKMQSDLIAFWMNDQKMTSSLLINAGKTDEKEKIDAVSGVEFFRFLNDLKHFLEDLKDSCTLAHKSYQEFIQSQK